MVHAQKMVALTFDDGPDSSYTEILLDILKKENVKATFFVLGDKVKKFPEITKRIDAEGHLIGNHSRAHKNFTEYTDSTSVLKDIDFVDSVLYATIGKRTHYFRPPYGAIREDQKPVIQNNGHELAWWTLSPRDWNVKKITAENILDTVKIHLHNRAVILLHSKDVSGNKEDYPFWDNTIKALPKVIHYLRKKGYNFVTFDKVIPKIGGDAQFLEKELRGRKDIVFYGGFEEGFNTDYWKKKWGIKWTMRAEKAKIIPNAFMGGRSLRVDYPKGGLGPSGTGVQFPIVLRDMPGVKEGYYHEAYLRYYVKFEDGFDFRKGGKLPGLMGGGNSWTRSGGIQPNGKNGWTMRFMWVDSGKIVVYAYVPKSKNGKWGGKLWGQGIDCGFKAKTGKWICIEQYINVGTPDKDDGKLKVWINGIQKININDMRFWTVKNDSGKIGGVYFSTFHGGNAQDWSPRNDSFIQFDGFVIAKKRIGPYEKRNIK